MRQKESVNKAVEGSTPDTRGRSRHSLGKDSQMAHSEKLSIRKSCHGTVRGRRDGETLESARGKEDAKGDFLERRKTTLVG